MIGGSPEEARAFQKRFNVYTMPALTGPLAFPPTGVAYRQNGESHAIWRWLGLHAPDLVVIRGDDYGLAEALGKNAAGGMGRIPAQRTAEVPKRIERSEAHVERDRRLARTPRQFAEELAKVYGHEFDQAVYIPAMALIGRLRLGEQADVAALAAPYVDGRKDSLEKATGSHYAGHLLFAELADRTGDQRYKDRVKAAAEMEVEKPMHNEMSDSVFMGCPILAAAGKYDAAVEHFRFMRKLCLRPDGLYRHSPLNEAAWGRGNAFPALGLSWTLLRLPASHPGYAELLENFRGLMATLSKFQDSDGMWHQVVDRPDSYAEFSATAMIATAMKRGVVHGWLDKSYEPRIQAAWRAILVRSGAGGALVDVCESTGKQKSVEDYFNRAASFGKDARGGGMALLLATELMAK
jgi:rhamnogalacturonyl hydrolase YesR